MNAIRSEMGITGSEIQKFMPKKSFDSRGQYPFHENRFQKCVKKHNKCADASDQTQILWQRLTVLGNNMLIEMIFCKQNSIG